MIALLPFCNWTRVYSLKLSHKYKFNSTAYTLYIYSICFTVMVDILLLTFYEIWSFTIGYFNFLPVKIIEASIIFSSQKNTVHCSTSYPVSYPLEKKYYEISYDVSLIIIFSSFDYNGLVILQLWLVIFITFCGVFLVCHIHLNFDSIWYIYHEFFLSINYSLKFILGIAIPFLIFSRYVFRWMFLFSYNHLYWLQSTSLACHPLIEDFV